MLEMQPSLQDPIERAKCSLEGLSVGDAFGETYFVNPDVVDGLIAERALAARTWTYTDDTLQARDMSDSASVEFAVSVLGNGVRVSAQDTVPFALWCAAKHLSNYEEALWLAVSGLGDRDTTCAIVGGIVASFTGIEGIPQEWLKSRESLPDWPFNER